jgi:hypothetical protein
MEVRISLGQIKQENIGCKLEFRLLKDVFRVLQIQATSFCNRDVESMTGTLHLAVGLFQVLNSVS